MNMLVQYMRRYAAILFLLFVISGLGFVTGGDVDAMQRSVNDGVGIVVAYMAKVIFWSFPGFKMPLVVIVLITGAIFFTFRFAFINIRGMKHAAEVVTGVYDDPEAEGEVNHFQALSSALSATVGLGNIGGVALAVSMGGPGAVFWMVVAAFFGMASKFTECTLGQMYREVDADGHVRGGPMVYLREGLKEKGMGPLGKVLSVMFAVLCIGGSFGGGNMFQANQSFEAVSYLIPAMGGGKAEGVTELYVPAPIELQAKSHLVRFQTEDGKVFHPKVHLEFGADDWEDYDGAFRVEVPIIAAKSSSVFNVGPKEVAIVELGVVQNREVKWTKQENIIVLNPDALVGGSGHFGWLYGILLAVLVGIVIVGGIKRIGKVADKIVPAMCVFYVLTGVVILLIHFADIPDALSEIVGQAFNPNAMYGGFLGVLITGIQRAAFSNEAGVGSAAIAHSAAKTKYPVREGLVALLEPFIDTIIICSMTGLVIVITGVYADPTTAGLSGVQLTTAAFEESLSTWAGLLLSVSVVLFAFSTMISWSYYGERCWSYLFGKDQTQPYRYIFCFFVWLGCVTSLQNVIDFSDLMILSMAFPNIIGCVLLSGKVKTAIDEYWADYKAGRLIKYK